MRAAMGDRLAPRMPRGGKPGALAAFATSAALFAQLATLRRLVRADDTRAYFLGRPLTAACAFRSRYGVPCPACGATRGFAFSLHLDFARAFRFFPAAPLVVLGLLAAALFLSALGYLEITGRRREASAASHAAGRAALLYTTATTLFWLIAWLARL